MTELDPDQRPETAETPKPKTLNHLSVIEACEELTAAFENLRTVWTRELKTADGYDFDVKYEFNEWKTDYFAVVDTPVVVEVQAISIRRVHSIEADEDGIILAVDSRNQTLGGRPQNRYFNLRELFKYRENAVRYARQLYLERIVRIQNEIDHGFKSILAQYEMLLAIQKDCDSLN